MRYLENKIPPPIVGIIFGFIIWLIAKYSPTLNFNQEIQIAITSLFVIAGFYFCVAGAMLFKKSDTTINPLQPETASSLVKTGVYKISRNPMYVGLTLFLIAWSLYLGSIFGLIGALGFALYLTQFQIKPEEKALTELFGKEFIGYKSKVRRWL